MNRLKRSILKEKGRNRNILCIGKILSVSFKFRMSSKLMIQDSVYKINIDKIHQIRTYLQWKKLSRKTNSKVNIKSHRSKNLWVKISLKANIKTINIDYWKINSHVLTKMIEEAQWRWQTCLKQIFKDTLVMIKIHIKTNHSKSSINRVQEVKLNPWNRIKLFKGSLQQSKLF